MPACMPRHGYNCIYHKVMARGAVTQELNYEKFAYESYTFDKRYKRLKDAMSRV